MFSTTTTLKSDTIDLSSSHSSQSTPQQCPSKQSRLKRNSKSLLNVLRMRPSGSRSNLSTVIVLDNSDANGVAHPPDVGPPQQTPASNERSRKARVGGGGIFTRLRSFSKRRSSPPRSSTTDASHSLFGGRGRKSRQLTPEPTSPVAGNVLLEARSPVAEVTDDHDNNCDKVSAINRKYDEILSKYGFNTDAASTRHNRNLPTDTSNASSGMISQTRRSTVRIACLLNGYKSNDFPFSSSNTASLMLNRSLPSQQSTINTTCCSSTPMSVKTIGQPTSQRRLENSASRSKPGMPVDLASNNTDKRYEAHKNADNRNAMPTSRNMFKSSRLTVNKDGCRQQDQIADRTHQRMPTNANSIVSDDDNANGDDVVTGEPNSSVGGNQAVQRPYERPDRGPIDASLFGDVVQPCQQCVDISQTMTSFERTFDKVMDECAIRLSNLRPTVHVDTASEIEQRPDDERKYAGQRTAARNKITMSQISSIDSTTTDLSTGQEFRDLADRVAGELEKLCLKFDNIVLSEDVPDDASGNVNAVVGKTRLLLRKKMKQFRELCEKNIQGTMTDGVFETKVDDLRGFWDMVCIQVEECQSNFQKIDILHKSGWSSADQPSSPTITTVTSPDMNGISSGNPDKPRRNGATKKLPSVHPKTSSTITSTKKPAISPDLREIIRQQKLKAHQQQSKKPNNDSDPDIVLPCTPLTSTTQQPVDSITEVSL